MIQAVHPLQVSYFYFQVLLSSIERPMPQELGDIGDIDMAMQQMGRRSVAKRIDSQVLFQF